MCFANRSLVNKDSRARCRICCNSKARSVPASYEGGVHRFKWGCLTSRNYSRDLKNSDKTDAAIGKHTEHTLTLTNACTPNIHCVPNVHFHMRTLKYTSHTPAIPHKHMCKQDCFVCDNYSAGGEAMRRMCGHDCLVPQS